MRIKALWPLVVAMAISAMMIQACPAKKPSQCDNEKYVPALKSQGKQLYQKGDLIGALTAFREAEACSPKDPELYYMIGLVYYKKDDIHKAIANFEKSLEIDPDFTESRLALGVAHLALGKWDDAIREFEKATSDELFKRPWEIYNNIGWAYIQKGELELAEVNVRRALRENGQFCPAYCNLGEILSRKGDTRGAILNFNKAISLCGANFARPHFLLGIEFGKIGRTDKACEELKKAASMRNSNESEQAAEYMRLYNCPGVILPPPGE